MKIILTKEQIKEALGELRFMGAEYCYRFDRVANRKTEEVEAVKLHLASVALGNSIDVRLESTELPKINSFDFVELDTVIYDPYVQQGKFAVLVDKFTCKGIRTMPNKTI